MPIEFKLPELGENVEKGDVVRVLVSPGDVIRADQPVLELETDKATIEVPTSVGGTVTEVKVKAGDKVNVGEVVLLVEEKGAAGASAAQPKKEAAEAPPAQPKQEAAETPSAPAVQPKKETTEAPPAPARKEPAPQKPASVVDISAGRPPAAPVREAPPARGAPAAARGEAAAAAAALPVESTAPVAAAPSVRRFARELGVNIAQVSGSGPGGRIGQEDVKQFVKASMGSPGRAPGAARPVPLPDFSRWGEIDVKPMSNIRRKTAEHLSAAWQAPHVTQHDKADVSAIEEFRRTYGPRVEQSGGKLTVTAILIKIVALAIGRYPQFASSPDMASESIIYKKYVHIGVAVDTPNGLLVPVIRDADRKTITEIAGELTTLSQKARDRKLSLDEMAGGVFSITNLGGIGGTSFTPIVNQPEVAILGVSRTATEPVWKDGQFVPRQMLPLALSYDHRVIDGADAARFLRFIAEALEQPLMAHL